MLDAMRRGAGTWIVKSFLGVLVLSFAAWGIGDIFRISPDTAVATVGDVEISQTAFTEAFNRDLAQLQRRFGGNIDAEQARQFGLVQQTISRLVTEAVYDQATRDLGLTVSDATIREEIKNNRSFQNEFGNFDPNRFEQVLQQNGFSEQRYVAERKIDLARQQLFDSMTVGGYAPKKMVDLIYRYQNQRRVAEILKIPFDSIAPPPTPDATTLAAYHDKHSTRYTAPELRALTFITMRPLDLLEEVAVDAQEVRDDYEARIAAFTVLEQREVEQIRVQEKELADKIANKIANGDEFYAVAKELANQAQDQVKLGKLQKGDLPGDVDDAVFALTENAISQPLESPFGWHLFRVTSITPGHQKTFEEVKNQIEGELRLERATDALLDLTNRVDDALAGGADLKEVAESFRLKLTKVAAVSAAGRDAEGKPVPGLPRFQGFLRAAFEVGQGEEPVLQEASNGGYYLVRVDGITAPAVRPLAEVRDKVIADWQDEERRLAGEAKAKELVDKARSGENLASLATANGFESLTTEPLTRAELGAKASFGQSLVAKFFELKAGDVDTGSNQAGDGELIVRVKEIKHASATSKPADLKSLGDGLKGSVVGDLLAQFNKAMEASLDVEINHRAANAIFDQSTTRNYGTN